MGAGEATLGSAALAQARTRTGAARATALIRRFMTASRCGSTSERSGGLAVTPGLHFASIITFPLPLDVGLKSILPKYASDPHFQRMFLDEARMAAFSGRQP